MADEEDDYESLPAAAAGPIQNMTAGAFAGVMEHCVVYPVDVVKTRLQCLRPAQEARYSGLFDGLRRLIHTEGIGRTMRGMSAVVTGAAPAHALYFGSYEQVKKLITEGSATNSVFGAKLQHRSSTLAVFTAGFCATILHDAVMTPADAVKQRLQMFNSPYRNARDCFVTVVKTEGGGALYRAYLTQLTMNAPHQMVHFYIYERCQDFINREREYRPLSHVCSGAMAGGTAAAITNPLDVCKTLLNTQERCALDACHCERVVGIRGAARAVWKLEGFRGFLKGMQARIVFQMPGTAICWGCYETFKWWLSTGSGGASGIPRIPSPASASATD